MVEVYIEKPTYGLSFVGKTSQSVNVLVPYALPGEIWKVEHLKEEVYRPVDWIKLNWQKRRVPPCAYFPYCSGCQWQHIKPEGQLEFKLKLFKKFIGTEPDIVLISPSEFHYRNRTVLYFKNGILGHRRSWIFDLKMQPFPLDYCLLLHPKINEALKLLKGFKFPENLHGLEIFTNPQSGETFLKLLVRGEIKEALIDLARKFPFAGVGIYTGEYLHWERKLTFGEWESSIKVNNYIFKISPDSFLQPNYLLWEKFQKLVKPLSESYKKAVELHAGIGFFTPAIAKRSREVESSDINPFAGKLREENLNRNGIKNVKNLVADAYKHIKRTKNFDLLLVDPPRGGLAKPVLKEILKKLPEEIIYVSCNLQSLKGDLETLKEKYKIVKTVLVDQFPNTYHIESIIWLKKT